MRDALLQFVIIGTFQIFCKICQVGKAPAFQGCCLCFLAAGIGARQCVRYTAVFAGIPIQNALAAPGIEVVGILFACINAIRSGAQGLCCRCGAGGDSAQESQGRPPADALLPLAALFGAVDAVLCQFEDLLK